MGGKYPRNYEGKTKILGGKTDFGGETLVSQKISPHFGGKMFSPQSGGKTPFRNSWILGGKHQNFPPKRPIFPPKFLKTPCFGGNEKVIFPPYGQ